MASADIDQSPTSRAGLTIAQAANHLGISENAVRQRIKRGTLEATKVDGVWSITLDDQTDHEAGYEATTGRDYQADHEDIPSSDQATNQSASREVMVSVAARAQVALFHEISAPLVDRIEAQAETIGQLTAERDQLRADLERLRERTTAAPSVDAHEGPGREVPPSMAPGYLSL